MAERHATGKRGSLRRRAIEKQGLIGCPMNFRAIRTSRVVNMLREQCFRSTQEETMLSKILTTWVPDSLHRMLIHQYRNTCIFSTFLRSHEESCVEAV